MCKDVANGSRDLLENTKHMQLTLLYKLQRYNNMMPLGLTFYSFKEARGFWAKPNEREKVILKQISADTLEVCLIVFQKLNTSPLIWTEARAYLIIVHHDGASKLTRDTN